MHSRVLLLATLDTKQQETDYLVQCLHAHAVDVSIIDTSLQCHGETLCGEGKAAAMQASVQRAINALGDADAVVGLGGGTGGEIAIRVMRALPITFPKMLVTTLPFDPRGALADSSIVIVPTLADLCGLNATLREVLENTAAMLAGLCATRRQANACVETPSVGITALGATEGAVSALVRGLHARGRECTVFHANGFGGAAFARFAERGAFHSIVDATPHELTRLHLAGAHIPMPTRFSAASELPRVVLPGALNFIGLGEASLLPSEYLARPHYAHSGYFTHAKLTHDEMARIARILADSLLALSGPVHLIVPMGGFSHQDCPNGAIEDPPLRRVFLDTVTPQLAGRVVVTEIDAHIDAPAVTTAILDTLGHYNG